jgi:hypothetical protein
MSQRLSELESRLTNILTGLEQQVSRLQTSIDRLSNSSVDAQSSLDLSDYHLESLTEEYYTRELFLRGVDGVHSFIVDYIATDDRGNLAYRCLDHKRATFGYISDNTIHQDHRCKVLLDALQPHIVRVATRYYKAIIGEIYGDGDSSDEDDSEIHEVIAASIASNDAGDQDETVNSAVNNFLLVKRTVSKNRNALIRMLCDSLYGV